MSFFLVLGLVLILDLLFSSANILNVLTLATRLGSGEIGDLTAQARQHEDLLTRKVYAGLINFMDPYVVYE